MGENRMGNEIETMLLQGVYIMTVSGLNSPISFCLRYPISLQFYRYNTRYLGS